MNVEAPDRPPTVRLQRSNGAASVKVDQRNGHTVLCDLYQHANAKLRIPKTYGHALEAVLINTAGGIAGGDTLKLAAHAGAGSALTVTTQACERLYRSAGDGVPSLVENRLTVDAGAFAAWLPQETIAFDGSAMRRSLDVDLAPGASCLIHETIIFGRALMGEKVRQTQINDNWTVRRDGALVHAERLSIGGHFDDVLQSPALLNGRTVVTTLLLVPETSGEAIEHVARRLRQRSQHDGVMTGVSVFADKLVCRLLSADSRALRAVLPHLIGMLRPGLEMPKVWRF